MNVYPPGGYFKKKKKKTKQTPYEHCLKSQVSTDNQMRSQSYNSPSLPNVPHSKPLSSTTLTHTHTPCLNPTTKPLHKTRSLPRPLSTIVLYGTIPKVLRGHESLCFHQVHTHCSKTPCTAYLHWP